MNTQTKHTPGPWYTRHGQISSLSSSHGCTIANCNRTAKGIPDEEIEANAAFIVRACNAHDDLLNALQLAVATIERLERHAPNSANGTLDVAKAAIAKAEDR